MKIITSNVSLLINVLNCVNSVIALGLNIKELKRSITLFIVIFFIYFISDKDYFY
jgi:hypothetical protein